MVSLKQVELSKKLNPFLTSRYSNVILTFVVLSLLFLNTTVVFGNRASEGPDVILVSIDDLRADHLGCYGYSRHTSPHIDAFAKGGIIFSHCYVPEPWTLPSHVSMLTSLYPITHGVDKTHRLEPAVVTLAEVLKKEGYQTAGFVSGGPWTSAGYGFGQGFDIYSAGQPERLAEYQNESIKNHLKKNKEKKSFLFSIGYVYRHPNHQTQCTS